jgi:hypothetical protein
LGRFATQYLALPYGGAYLALEGLKHLVTAITGKGTHLSTEVADVYGSSNSVTALSSGFLLATLLVGTWLAFLLHRPVFRTWCLERLRFAWQLFRQIVVELPAGLLRSPLVQRVLRSPVYAALRSYVLRPALLTLLAAWLFRSLQRPFGWHLAIDVFLLMALVLNSPVGRYADEWIGGLLVRAWHDLRIRVFAAAFQWIMDTFHRLLESLERLVYTVDEWLRFRAGDNRQVQMIKLVAGLCWFFVSYFVVFVFTLLVEPQVNPIKHFPVVTVSHKLILPAGPAFVERLQPYIGKARAATLVWSTIWLIPGVFGFLVWELKENWRLYAANRSPTLVPIPIGHHGETMVRLLRPGFHSGTLPKLFARLRRASRKDHLAGGNKLVSRKQVQLHRVEESVQRFVERELLSLLRIAEVSPEDPLVVQRVQLATNRVDVHLQGERSGRHALRLTWEEDQGQIWAEVSGRNWIEQLPSSSHDTVLAALRALFQRSGADNVNGPPDLTVDPPMSWPQWLRIWSHEPLAMATR